MLKTIQQFFRESLHQPENPVHTQQQLQLATATLLVEVMQIDNAITASEETRLAQILEKTFALDPLHIQQLITLAKQQVSNSVDLYQFTRLINQHYSRSEKYHLLLALWQIAYADQQLDKYEESMIRKICDLIYMDHVDFIRAKKEAQTGG